MVTKYLGLVSKWTMFVVSIMVILGAFMHLDSQLSGQDWCEMEKRNYGDDVSCVGDSLVWKKGKDGVKDYNGKWRETFSFRPTYFVDTWTPFFFGAFAFLQCFSTFKHDTVVGSWGRCLAFWLFGAFWAIFGYAGNWGVFWGFFVTLFLCPLLLALTFLDKECEDTQVDMIHYLAMAGLTNEAPPKEENNDVRGPPSGLMEEQQQHAYPVVNVEADNDRAKDEETGASEANYQSTGST